VVYAHKKADLQELERLSEKGLIALFYGDESQVSSEGYVPYGWQFPDEEIAIYVEKSYKMNIFGLISRTNECAYKTTEQNIDSQYVCQFLEEFSFQIKKETFVVLDNASVHKSKLLKQNLPIWEKRGLFILFLPTYSPHLNIAEIMWRKLKTEWLVPEDYLEKDTLFYAVNRCMANVGKELKINFSPFNIN
jgi:transposase